MPSRARDARRRGGQQRSRAASRSSTIGGRGEDEATIKSCTSSSSGTKIWYHRTNSFWPGCHVASWVDEEIFTGQDKRKAAAVQLLAHSNFQQGLAHNDHSGFCTGEETSAVRRGTTTTPGDVLAEKFTKTTGPEDEDRGQEESSVVFSREVSATSTPSFSLSDEGPLGSLDEATEKFLRLPLFPGSLKFLSPAEVEEDQQSATCFRDALECSSLAENFGDEWLEEELPDYAIQEDKLILLNTSETDSVCFHLTLVSSRSSSSKGLVVEDSPHPLVYLTVLERKEKNFSKALSRKFYLKKKIYLDSRKASIIADDGEEDHADQQVLVDPTTTRDTMSILLYMPPGSIVEGLHLVDPEMTEIITNILPLKQLKRGGPRGQDHDEGKENEYLRCLQHVTTRKTKTQEQQNMEEANDSQQSEEEEKQAFFDFDLFPLLSSITPTFGLPTTFLCSQSWAGSLTHCADSSTFYAVDFDAPVGTPIISLVDGRVKEVTQGSDACFGPDVRNLWHWNEVSIEFEEDTLSTTTSTSRAGNGRTSTSSPRSSPSATSSASIATGISKLLLLEYVHVGRVLVKEGDLVQKGQVIAFSGQSGFTPTPHLHLQLTRRGMRKQRDSHHEDEETDEEGGTIEGLPFTLRGEMCRQGVRYEGEERPFSPTPDAFSDKSLR
ncbi:unnamed protein product [Amoebophrya sp. A25]|nr:unnamed protein product [Amoebophrya sp. A25]|eukprot:GSA25T00016884001.1